jgi:hypothetical protein
VVGMKALDEAWCCVSLGVGEVWKMLA